MSSKTEKQKEEEKQALGVIALLAGISYIFSKINDILVNWHQYTIFNKIIAGIYYFIIYVPFKVCLLPWRYIYKNQLTSHSNLNLVLSIIVIILLFSIFIWTLKYLANKIDKLLPLKYYIGDWKLLFIIYLSPLILWGIVNLVKISIKWLLA